MAGDDMEWPSLDDTWHGDIDSIVPEGEKEFRVYVVRRLNRIDRDNRRILTILLIGKVGYRAMMWIGAAAATLLASLAAWKGWR